MPKRGRPPISDVAKSERPLRIRLTDEERRQLDLASGKKPTSTWAREKLLQLARRSGRI